MIATRSPIYVYLMVMVVIGFVVFNFWNALAQRLDGYDKAFKTLQQQIEQMTTGASEFRKKNTADVSEALAKITSLVNTQKAMQTNVQQIQDDLEVGIPPASQDVSNPANPASPQ
jgi:uncharacterized protein YoxC